MLLLLFQQDQGVYRRARVYIHVHAHTLPVAGAGYRLVQDFSSRAAVNTDKYSIRPVLPTTARELRQTRRFPPTCERPGVFSAARGARVPSALGPSGAWSCCYTKQVPGGETPSRAPSSPPVHPSMLCPLGMLRKTGVQSKERKNKRRKKKIVCEII